MKKINKNFLTIILFFNLFTLFIFILYFVLYTKLYLIKSSSIFTIINFSLVGFYFLVLLFFLFYNRNDKKLFKEEIIVISLFTSISSFIFTSLVFKNVNIMHVSMFLVMFCCIHLNITENYDFIKYLEERNRYDKF